jgi:hypothetical protein
MTFLANSQFPAGTVAILLRLDDRHRSGILAGGTFLALTAKQLKEGTSLCGVRADAIVWTDESLDDECRLALKCVLVAGAQTKKHRIL